MIFVDGAKSNTDIPSVAQVKAYLEKLKLQYPHIQLFISEKNLGLASSIIEGMTKVFQVYSCAIVVEDDLVLSPHFLNFMNKSLIRFENEKKISSIVGYSYPLGNGLPELLCQRGAECWGWATWKEKWEKYFEKDAKALLLKIKVDDLYALNVYNGYDYHGMLKACAEGKNQSWAIRWHVGNFVNHQYSVYPARSYVQNLGFDSSGTHCTAEKNFYEHTLFPMKPVDTDYPVKLEENVDYASRLSSLFNKESLYYENKHYSFLYSIKRFIHSLPETLRKISLKVSSYSELIQSIEQKKAQLPPFPTIIILKDKKDEALESVLLSLFGKPRIHYGRGISPVHMSIDEHNNVTFNDLSG